MNLASVGQTPQSYAKFKDYLSQQAELLDESLVDARPNSKDVFVKTSSTNFAESLEDAFVSEQTFARQGENLSLSVKKNQLIGYPISERSISFHQMADGKFRVTDFDGENLKEMTIEA